METHHFPDWSAGTMEQTRILDMDDRAGIEAGAAALAAGDLVAFPTETVYGLGADAANARAVAKVYTAKNRPAINPLISHFADAEAAMRHGEFNAHARLLARHFWPGPLTLVVPRSASSTICDLATAGLGSVALRVPDHAGARALLGAFGGPVVAPSANRSGYVSATTARHVAEDLGAAVSVILDGGQTGIGIESTVLDCTGETVRILRPGAITRTALRACLGEGLSEDADTGGKVLAPGMLASHYAPNALVRLAAAEIAEGEAALTFGAARPAGLEHAVAVRNLSRDADLEEAAANLFTALRDLDASGARRIAVSPIPDTGIGAAINDRLRRAAAPRDIPGA